MNVILDLDFWQMPIHVHVLSSYSLRLLLFADVEIGGCTILLIKIPHTLN